MRKKMLWTVAIFWILSTLLFQGCASHKPLVKENFAFLAPLTVVYYGDPDDIKVESTGGTVAYFATAGSPLVLIGSSVYEKSIQKEISSAIGPSFNELVMKKFMDRASKELPNWPVMTYEEKPISRSYISNFKGGNLMVFSCLGYFKTGGHRFKSQARAIIKDSEGNEIWRKDFYYNSKDFNREYAYKKDKTADFALLKEEIEFSADTIVSAFIEDLKK